MMVNVFKWTGLLGTFYTLGILSTLPEEAVFLAFMVCMIVWIGSEVLIYEKKNEGSDT
jgi:uncharacterized membrane protein